MQIAKSRQTFTENTPDIIWSETYLKTLKTNYELNRKKTNGCKINQIWIQKDKNGNTG